MADASDLFLPADPIAGAVDIVDPIDSCNGAPFWPSPSSSISSSCSSVCDDSIPGEAADIFIPVFSALDVSSDEEDRDLCPFSLDFFDRCRRRRRGADLFLGQSEGVGSDHLDLDLRLSLGVEGRRGEDAHREFVVATDGVPDWATDDFFVGRRSTPPPSESIEFSRARPFHSQGLRVVGFDSDSDSDEQIVAMGDEGISAVAGLEDTNVLGPSLCWDCFQFDESQRDPNEDFEWEEVDGRSDGRDVLNITAAGGSGEAGDLGRGEMESAEDLAGNVEWEFLMAVNNLGRNPMDPDDVEAYFVDDQEGFAYTSDYEVYEVLFGQFADQDSNIKGSPPAAKSVVDSLPSVILTKEEVASKDILCAICKDGILAEEKVKRLPCDHHYHEECILPWLRIRNTCPLCRFELPTDDQEYEKWKARRARGITSGDSERLGYDFEALSGA